VNGLSSSAETTQLDIPSSVLKPRLEAAIQSSNVRAIVKIRDELQSLKDHAERAKEGLSKQNEITTLKMVAERAAGTILRKIPIRRGSPKLYRDGTFPTLKDLGIDRKESSLWQSMSRAPDAAFVTYVKFMTENKQEMTSIGFRKFAEANYPEYYNDKLSRSKLELPLETPKLPITRTGDSWQLGEHQLFCGDSLEVLPTLGSVDLILTDPPYGQGRNYGRSNLGLRHFVGDGDLRWFPPVAKQFYRVLRNDSACLMFGQWRTSRTFIEHLTQVGFRLKTVGVWVKGVSGLGNGIAEGYEQVLFLYKGRPKEQRFTSNVFIESRVSGRPEHPAEKPVELLRDLMTLFDAETILDPFIGSGSTIVAAEKEGRTCLGVDIDPKYCDITVNRWQRFTHREAVLESTGQTFRQVSASRRKLRVV
jgi:DNA modification methylase